MLFKLGRYDDAIAAWKRALAGDGDSIDRGDIDKKIRSARQKLPKTMTPRARVVRGVSSAAAAATASCGAPLMKLPAGPGAPAADAADALAAGDRARAAPSRTLTAEIARQRIGRRPAAARPPARRPRRAGVGAPRSGRAVRRAGLHLRRAAATTRRCCCRATTACSSTAARRRCSRRSPACRSTPRDLRTTLTGCAGGADAAAAAQRRRRLAHVVRRPTELYLHRDGRPAPWRLVAAVQRRAGEPELARRLPRFRQDGLPRSIRLVSADGRQRFDLRLALSQVEINVPLEPRRSRCVPPARADHARGAARAGRWPISSIDELPDDARPARFAKINLSLRVLGTRPTAITSCARSFSRSRCTTR